MDFLYAIPQGQNSITRCWFYGHQTQHINKYNKKYLDYLSSYHLLQIEISL